MVGAEAPRPPGVGVVGVVGVGVASSALAAGLGLGLEPGLAPLLQVGPDGGPGHRLRKRPLQDLLHQRKVLQVLVRTEQQLT